MQSTEMVDNITEDNLISDIDVHWLVGIDTVGFLNSWNRGVALYNPFASGTQHMTAFLRGSDRLGIVVVTESVPYII